MSNKSEMTDPQRADDVDDLSPEMTKALHAFISGYFSGYQSGVIATAKILEAAEENNAPVPLTAKKWVAMLGRAIRESAHDLTERAMTSEAEEDDA